MAAAGLSTGRMLAFFFPFAYITKQRSGFQTMRSISIPSSLLGRETTSANARGLRDALTITPNNATTCAMTAPSPHFAKLRLASSRPKIPMLAESTLTHVKSMTNDRK